MSFTSSVKNEASKLEVMKAEKISELSAIVSNIAIIDQSIRITTENASVARRIFSLIKDIYEVSPKVIVRHGYNFSKSYIYILEINYKKNDILSDLTVFKANDIPNDYIVGDEDLIRAYLRGVFISCGSINDPKTSRYHLEFLVDEYNYAEFVMNLLNEFNLNSKIIKRDNKYMIYIKEAEKISDFLRIIKANSAVFYYEDIRIYRDHKNMTNRLNNCEQANVDKIIETAADQIKDIELLESVGGIELLDDKIREAATYRLKYPESSLLELSEIISVETSKPITKSGLYHRFKKIKSLASKIKDIKEK